MKILHVVQSLKGGPASYFDETIPYQIDRYGANNVALIIPADDQAYLNERTRAAKKYLFSSRSRSAKSLMEFYREFNRGVRDFQPDIIHLHSTFAGAIGRAALLLSRSKAKVVYCSHGWAFDMGGDDRPSLKKNIYALTERILALRTDQIVNISNADQDSAFKKRIGKGKSQVIHNGVSEMNALTGTRRDYQERLNMDTSKTNILFVGRFDRQKGFDVAIKAFEGLDPERFHLYAIGDFVVSNPQRQTDLLATGLPHVSLLGWKKREQLPPYFAAADAVIMPSRWEGFGLVAIEAMRVNTPVLATNVGALPELIEDRVNGRLVDESMAESIAEILMEETKESWHHYGLQARHRFQEKFTSAKLNEGLADLYAGLMPERQGSRVEA